MSPLPEDILRYLERHAKKMEGEGWHMTARVLEEAHMEIARLRAALALNSTQEPSHAR